MPIQAQIVTWNSERHIDRVLASLQAQTLKPDAIVVIDNNSKDGTRTILKKYDNVQTIFFQTNTGFSFPHNIGIQQAKDKGMQYVLILNPDIVLEPDTIQILWQEAERNPRMGSISPLLLRNKLTNGLKNSIVDSAGIHRTPYFQFKNIHENSEFREQRNCIKEVFANTGACTLLRVDAVSKICHKHKNKAPIEVFDETLFAYQEDSDLGWRLNKSGFKNFVTYKTHALHFRNLQKETSHRLRSDRYIFLSHRNHLLTIVKNISFRESLLLGLLILGYEFLKIIYLLVIHPRACLASISSFISLYPIIINKRRGTE